MLPFLFYLVCCLVAVPVKAEETNPAGASWYDSAFTAVPLKKILVVGLSDKLEQRQQFETAFVNMIRDAGGKGEMSFDMTPAGAGEGKNVIKTTVKEKGFDSVLVCRLLAADPRTPQPPAPTNRSSSGFDQDYDRMRDAATKANALAGAKTIVMQLKIFAAEGKLIWSAESETFDPSALKETVTSMTQALRKDLLEKGFIQPTK